MKSIDIARMFILEVFVGIVVYYILINNPKIVHFIASIFFIPKMGWMEYAKLFAFPLLLLTYSYKFGEEILNPNDVKARKTLKEFPSYWKLKNRIWYSILISLFMILGTIACWYNAVETKNIEYNTILILVFWSISLVAFFSIAKAKLDLKDILY